MMRANESILAVDFAVQDGVVRSQRRNSVEVIRPWGEQAGAWRSTGGSTLQPFSPEFHIGFLEETVLTAAREARLLPCRRRQVEAYQFLLGSWPEGVRRTVRRFRSSHWQLLQFVNRSGAWAEQLLWSNPALGFLAASCASPSTPGSSEESLDPRHLALGMKRRTMAAQFGFSEKESTVRLLGRVPAGWVSQDFLADLRTVLETHGAAAKLLAYVPRINPLIVQIACDPEIRSLFSFECLRQAAKIGPSADHCDVFSRVQEAVRSARQSNRGLPHYNQLSDIDRRPAPPPPPRPPAPVPHHGRRAFPPPPLAESEGIQAIRTRVDLKAEGRQMGHCVGTMRSYAEEVLSGSLYFYRMLEPERATICIRRVNGVWLLVQVRGPANRAVRDATEGIIQGWLRSRCDPEPSMPSL